MSLITFTDEQVRTLEKNPYVKTVTNKRITYTDEFKKLFIEQYRLGLYPRDIFSEAGFDVKALGYKRIERASDRWRKLNNEGHFGENINYVEVHKKRNKGARPEEEIIREQKKMIEQLLQENTRLKEQIEKL